MKRLFLFTAALAFLFACTTEQAPEPITKAHLFTNNTLAPEILKGQVKSYELRAYWVTEENGEYIQGAPITHKERDSIGWADDCIVYFDENGMAKKTENLGDDDVVLSYMKTYIEDKVYVKAEFFEKDTLRSLWKISHDDAGNIMKMEQRRMPEDTLVNTYGFTYDEKGNLISGYWTNYLGEKGWSNTFELNEAGLVLLNENTNPSGEKASWNKYSYDENGFMVKWDALRSDSSTIEIVEKYTKVDEKGNWLVMITIDKGELIGMDVRTIEYY